MFTSRQASVLNTQNPIKTELLDSVQWSYSIYALENPLNQPIHTSMRNSKHRTIVQDNTWVSSTLAVLSSWSAR